MKYKMGGACSMYGGQKKYEMGEACGTYGGQKKYINISDT
jgi:hypothetical protein